jgi:hypothetical protein
MSKTLVRRFNADGIEAFRRELAECRTAPTRDIPLEMLTDPKLTESVLPSVEIEPRGFKTKGDAAVYFHQIFAGIPKQPLLEDAGLWTWLSLYYFDIVCPKQSGIRKVRNDYTYVYEAKSIRHFYRHLLFVSWRTLDIAPTHNRLLLSTRISSLDKFSSEVIKRLYMTRIPCFFEVLDRLYWDEKRGRARPGVTHFGKVTAGNLAHRLPIRIRQLEKTYDLHSLTADQLLLLLGEEFQFDADPTTQLKLSFGQE